MSPRKQDSTDRMDQVKANGENQKADGKSDVFRCGVVGCEYFSETAKEWKEHYSSEHNITSAMEKEAVYYQNSSIRDDRIIGQMYQALTSYNIDISPYDLIEVDLRSFRD